MRESAAAWHDVECASYEADLPVWRELSERHGDPVLDIGCGTGRVALDLAGLGHQVTGLDADPALVRALSQRARDQRLRLDTVAADARSFELGRTFRVAIAPMQVVQLLGGSDGRHSMLGCARRHLDPGGVLAIALADPFEGVPAGEALPPLPDVREEDGWVLSSTPVAVRGEDGAVAIDRLRQAVSPAGELTEEMVTIKLDGVASDELEEEGRAEGLRPLERLRVPETRDHVGSTVIVLEAH